MGETGKNRSIASSADEGGGKRRSRHGGYQPRDIPHSTSLCVSLTCLFGRSEKGFPVGALRLHCSLPSHMRSALAVWLIVAYVLTAWRIWFPIVHYEVQKAEYIARCENRLKPQLRCNGKCVLARKLAQLNASTSDESAPTTVIPMADCPEHVEPQAVVVPLRSWNAFPALSVESNRLMSAVNQVAVPPPRG